MSVLVPSLINNHHHHPHSSYYSNNSPRRTHGNISQTKQNRLSMNKIHENEQTNDQVPHGVVNSMKQRFLDKVNESLLLNHASSNGRHTLSKPSSSNENLLQTKSTYSSLRHTARLSRSQDNLANHHTISSIPGQVLNNEQFTLYLQPKQDVIIVETTTTEESSHADDANIEKLHSGQKGSTHKQPYTDIHEDETPKPGTVTTVKNMFERQIRLSRYDGDKLFNTSTPGGSRMGSQHREHSTPTRSRSISPNETTLRQRRATISAPVALLTSTTLSLPVPASYPDLVISHTPPTDTNKNSPEQGHHETVHQALTKDKKVLTSTRNLPAQEQIPLTVVISDENSTNLTEQRRPNLLLPSTPSSEIVDSQPLDFKSRLALFNRTNTQKSNEHSTSVKKPPIHSHPSSTNTVSKPIVHQPVRVVHEERNDVHLEVNSNPLLISISRAVINTAKAVTFFGGNRVNGHTKSSLPSYILPPPPPPSSSSFTSQTKMKHDQSSTLSSADVLRAPDIVGGNVKLNKSSIFSGTKKDARVQFVDNVDTFEYPSYEFVIAELGSTVSDDENDAHDDDDESNGSIGDSNTVHNHISSKMNDKQEQAHTKIDSYTNDDELERLARINAKFNTSNFEEKSMKPKGTLHTFRPTHLDQYELGTQHGSYPTSKSSDILSPTHSYTILARQKLVSSSDISTKALSNHSILKYPQKPMFDMANNIQWSSMSTTTDLLF
ncbi:unnamed protein product [Adineta ricciae]|uniref:Uncharacterized protein n=1 Tax=Adineta ricciae TaxID=249248 RepID=A0A814AXV3_ADIRI|nr:unnamed protein product [Adineta ricciae]CAF0919179.1 unnamed protein product [Adineta ricciae]